MFLCRQYIFYIKSSAKPITTPVFLYFLRQCSAVGECTESAACDLSLPPPSFFSLFTEIIIIDWLVSHAERVSERAIRWWFGWSSTQAKKKKKKKKTHRPPPLPPPPHAVSALYECIRHINKRNGYTSPLLPTRIRSTPGPSCACRTADC